MKVALTGASGHLGSALLQELAARHIPVHALYRDADTRSSNSLPSSIIQGNILNRTDLSRFMQGCDTVIHAAAVISINKDPNGLVYMTNVEGTRLVVHAALAAGVKKFIYISSIHAYQQKPSFEVLDEQRQPVNENAYAYDRSKQAAKLIALEANQYGMEVICIHPSSLIGPYDFKPSLMGKVLIDLYKGQLPFIFNGGFDFCDCRDVARGIVQAIDKGKAGESYLMGGSWYSLKQITQLLSVASNKKINPVSLPRSIAKLGLPVVKLWATIQQQQPLYTHEAIDALFAGNRLISSLKARNELDYTTRPLEETIHDTFHWFKNNGYLDSH